MTNPWMSLWLSAANSWAGAAHGFWMAEMRRQQTMMTNQMIKESTRFWMRAWQMPATDDRKKTRRR